MVRETDLPFQQKFEHSQTEEVIKMFQKLLNNSKVRFSDRTNSRVLRFYGFKASNGADFFPAPHSSFTHLFEPSTESYTSERFSTSGNNV